MGFFLKGKDENLTIIAGCGRLGANLANTLSDAGESVIVVDKNRDAFHKLSPSFSGIVITGDATETIVLSEAQIEKATAVISVTNRDNTNILIAQIAKEIFRIRNVIARLYDSERECIYRDFDINTICPAVLSAKEVDKLINMTKIERNAV